MIGAVRAVCLISQSNHFNGLLKQKKKHEIRNEMTNNKKTINVLSVLHDSLCSPYVDLNVFSSCFNFNRNHVFNALHSWFVLSNFGIGCRFAFIFPNEHTNLMQNYTFRLFISFKITSNWFLRPRNCHASIQIKW